ncbi:ATP-binding protein [Luteolibacter yonseiensis]
MVSIVLLLANLLTYQEFQRTLYQTVDDHLMLSVSLLAKSTELEASGVDYEWQEAMKSAGASDVAGVFAFWDLTSGKVTKSPELGGDDLPLIYGKLNEPVKDTITLTDGRRARVVGLLHHPFADQEGIDLAASQGLKLIPGEHPQVVVCALEMESLVARLSELKEHLFWGAVATLAVIWVSIFGISNWCLRPLKEFSAGLLERSENESPGHTNIPRSLPSELVGLANTFNIVLDKVERSRMREKEFALRAAHELRTPVAGIYATLEQSVSRDRPVQDLQARIREALNIADGMRTVLDSLMRLARIRGGFELSIKTMFSPASVVREILDSNSSVMRSRDLRLIADIPEHLPAIQNDVGLFKVVAANLIENSVSHSPPGSEIHVGLVATATELSLVCMNPTKVELEESSIEQWFLPFHRGSVAMDDASGHAGLGLSLAREAADLLGGKLQAEAVDRENILFKFLLSVSGSGHDRRTRQP